MTMAGYEVVKVATDGRGGVDLDDLRSKVDEQVACLMLTNPNTLGLDENIEITPTATATRAAPFTTTAPT